jgi:hypothetical protein
MDNTLNLRADFGSFGTLQARQRAGRHRLQAFC